MKTYARIQDGIVAEIIPALLNDEGDEIPIDERFVPEFVAALVDVTNVDPRPEGWWTYDGSTFSPPVPV